MRQHLDLMDRVPLARKERNRFKEVETVRLFTASGHPWIAFAALVVWRLPFPALAVAMLIYAKNAML